MDPTSNISRWVTFLLAPLATLAAGLAAHAALSVFGIALDPTATAAWMLGAMLSLAGLAYKWLHNRGRYEIAHLLNTNVEMVDRVVGVLEERLPAPPATVAEGGVVSREHFDAPEPKPPKRPGFRD